jgi:hypothetical protein
MPSLGSVPTAGLRGPSGVPFEALLLRWWSEDRR